MGYRFCFGASGAGKSRFLHSEILEKADPSRVSETGLHDSCVIIVPDQYSMQTQKDIVEESAQKGIMNIDVLSFGRLTYRIFEETGVSGRAVLDEVGKTLLIRRMAGKCERDLRILNKSIHYPGMIGEIKSILSEFMQYGIGEEELSSMRRFAGDNGQGALKARLDDLQTLFAAFLKGKKDRYITSEEKLDLLAEAIPSSGLVRRSVFILDGFTGFTPVQYRVIAALIRCSKDVVIALPFGNDGGVPIEKVHGSKSPGAEESLFYLTRKTVCDIDVIAGREGLVRKDDIVIGAEGTVPHRFRENPVLAHLEHNIFRHPSAAYDKDPMGRIRVMETNTPEEEVRQICIQIRKLILTQGYQYRNISVVCGDLVQYGPLFEKLSAEYDIPVYIDQTRTAGLNPLTEAIKSVLQIRPEGYSYAAVFRYLRSGMSNITREETDLLENYCLAHGIRGRAKWSLPFDAQTEPLRVRFLQEIEPVAGSISLDRVQTATAALRTESLYRFMTGLSMEEKMEKWASSFREAGDYVREKQFSQMYRNVISLLEQIHELLGDEMISAPEYEELLEAGFAQIRLGTLPQQADRVLVGDIERTRLSECRVLFFAGVNDGSIPRGTSRGGLLSDLDREFLRASGTELSPTPRQQIYQQRLYLYLNVTKPTDALCLSFARTSPDGGSLHPSYLIQVIRKMFPQVQILHPQLGPLEEQLTAERDSVAWLSGAIREYAAGRLAGTPQENRVETAYGYLMREGSRETSASLEQLKDAAFMRYDPVWISADSAHGLYGDNVTGGVSRMETAAKCSLRQFLQYGLRLTKRKEYVIEPADTGSILHQSLDRFGRKLKSRGLTWTEFTPDQGAQIMTESLKETAAAYDDLLMYSTERSRHQLDRMRRILQRSAETLQYQLLKGEFEPAGSEFSFGPGGEADAVSIPLGEGRCLRLVGRIDRVDLAHKDDAVYVKILDYKSGALSLDPELIQRGIQLQLIIYMNAVIRNLSGKTGGRRVVPSAMLYYQIKDPVLDPEKAKSALSDTDPEGKVLDKIHNELKPSGMILADPASYRLLDRDACEGCRSDVVPLTVKKDGTFGQGSAVYTQEEFESLTSIVRENVCRLAEEILEGKAAAEPAVWDKDRSACDYCPYRSVCGFDPSIAGYRYREQ